MTEVEQKRAIRALLLHEHGVKMPAGTAARCSLGDLAAIVAILEGASSVWESDDLTQEELRLTIDLTRSHRALGIGIPARNRVEKLAQHLIQTWRDRDKFLASVQRTPGEPSNARPHPTTDIVIPEDYDPDPRT